MANRPARVTIRMQRLRLHLEEYTRAATDMEMRTPSTGIASAAPAVAGLLSLRDGFPRRLAAFHRLVVLLLAALLTVSGLCFMSSGGLIAVEDSSEWAAQTPYGVGPTWELLGRSLSAGGTAGVCAAHKPAVGFVETSKVSVDEIFGFVGAREGAKPRTAEADMGRVPPRAQETPEDTALPHQLLRRPPPRA